MKGKSKRSGKEWETKEEVKQIKSSVYKVKREPGCVGVDAWVAVTLIIKGINVFKRTSMVQSTWLVGWFVPACNEILRATKTLLHGNTYRKEGKSNKATSWYCSR